MRIEYIHIKGAKEHNLKGVEVKIPHGKMTVITGLSGSGKSSLAFDTLYAEGQRRYIESLSAYARQFLGKLDKPSVDFIKGVAPAIAIQQKVTSTNPRSTVGTVTEIYDYLKVLFARVGKTYSPISGNEVKKHDVTDVVNLINSREEGEKFMVLAPVENYERYGLERQFNIFKEQGFSRVRIDDEVMRLDQAIENLPKKIKKLEIVIDRLGVRHEDEDHQSRIADSVQLSFAEGNGSCLIFFPKSNEIIPFSNRFELDGMQFAEPNLHFFTFNNPYGACDTCEGFGSVIGVDEDLVIPDRSKSLYDFAVLPWKGEKMSRYLDQFIAQSASINFPIHRPIKDLTDKEYDILWNGKGKIEGINHFFEYLNTKKYKIHVRVMLARYRGKTKCPDCQGTRLRKDANYVKVGGKNISEMILTSIEDNLEFFRNIKLDAQQLEIGKRVLEEIQSRLNWLNEVGLGYLTLNRQANTLSGGESQRINLATSLGSSLVGSMYILDEPSIGLHPKDIERLVGVLQELKALGNTVIIVEHEEAIMKAADEILDIGPLAGINGGELVFQGTHKELINAKRSLTADYLTGRKEIPVPKQRRKLKDAIHIIEASENNLKKISVKVPLHGMVCVTGVSGSGKSTLIKNILYPALAKKLGIHGNPIGKHTEITGDFSQVEAIEFIDQNPIGRSSRSNPVTYVKAFDEIRTLYSRLKLAKMRNLKPGYFSFNVPGGRCEVCEGEGLITVSMQFMADIQLTCETCNGGRYKDDALEIKYEGKSIADLLDMDIAEALDFFKAQNGTLEKKIVDKIQPLVDVGLGYLTMGQSSSTLSGGEAQRIKLASFLVKAKNPTKTLFIFDEPTTGLHFDDVNKLLISLNRLIEIGHSVIIIEHDMDVVKNADWVIDLGPEGGVNGGQLMGQGTPEDLVKIKESFTGKYLREKL
ncbi:excinuclease ABC subunit UvrA [Brumimicrobium aurantiacum]|uniref:UvrABC system protein A n=1 Tax=Brumimicrobium aurantiacum TaxID=1737063 RepID=A0A3E1EYB3_9FLAO|nr:excinuclease ABC subunit UvrA [Brumimicrobium aurantiacum]RFC54551.1 excinuclease ABC subunit A [Brumimicrobium aurantiacum]